MNAASHPLSAVGRLAGLLWLVVLQACGGGSGAAGGGGTAPEPPSSLIDLVCSGAPGRGWCWQAPLPSAETVKLVQFASPRSGVVAGHAGYLQATRDGGGNWTRLPRTGFDFVDVAMLDASVGWARSKDLPIVLKTLDGGLSWQRQPIDFGTPGFSGAPSGLQLEVIDASTVMVRSLLGNGGLSSLTRDGGATWTPVPTPATAVLPGGIYWSATERTSRGLPTRFWDYARHTGFGATSTPLGELPRCAARLLPLDASRVVAYCSEGLVTGLPAPLVFFSDDGGLNWRDLGVRLPPLASPAWTMAEVRLDAGGNGLAVLRDETVGSQKLHLLRVSQAATRWESLALPAAFVPWALPLAPLISDSALWLVDGNGRAQLSTDRGLSWRELNNGAEAGRPQRLTRDGGGGWLAEYFDVRRASDGTVISGPEFSRFHRSSDAGATWQPVPGSRGPDARRVVAGLVFLDARRGFALDDDGGLRSTVDGGRTWVRRAPVPGGATARGFSGLLQFSTATQGWMIDRGRLLSSTDAGGDWNVAAVPAGMASLVDLQFLDGRQGWAVTEAGRLFATGDGGARWTAATQPPGLVKLVRFADAQVGAALVNDGVFHDAVWHTRDGGRSWAITNFQGHSGEDIVQLRYADAANLTMIGMRRDKERLWRSSDGGATWRAGRLPLADVGLTALQFLDARRGRLLAQGGVTLATEDAGDSWTVIDAGPIGDVSYFDARLSMFWLDPSTGWLGGAAGAILATVTGGRR